MPLRHKRHPSDDLTRHISDDDVILVGNQFYLWFTVFLLLQDNFTLAMLFM